MVVGLDPNLAWLNYAAHEAAPNLAWVGGRAEALPFPERSFDVVLSVTALCFISDQLAALREMLRVCRRRFALGLLNRHSLLWRQKGRGEGVGAYRGAHWHTVREVHALAANWTMRVSGGARPCSSRAAAGRPAGWKTGCRTGCRGARFSRSWGTRSRGEAWTRPALDVPSIFRLFWKYGNNPGSRGIGRAGT